TWSNLFSHSNRQRMSSKFRSRRAKSEARRHIRTRHLRLAAEWLEPRYLLASSVLPLGSLQLAFEVNAGQTNSQVDFLAHGKGYTVFLTPGEAVLSLAPAAGDGSGSDDADQVAALRVQLVGANATGHGT